MALKIQNESDGKAVNEQDLNELLVQDSASSRRACQSLPGTSKMSGSSSSFAKSMSSKPGISSSKQNTENTPTKSGSSSQSRRKPLVQRLGGSDLTEEKSIKCEIVGTIQRVEMPDDFFDFYDPAAYFTEFSESQDEDASNPPNKRKKKSSQDCDELIQDLWNNLF